MTFYHPYLSFSAEAILNIGSFEYGRVVFIFALKNVFDSEAYML